MTRIYLENRGSDFVAPVQRNAFGILEVKGNPEYTIFMVVWLYADGSKLAEEFKHHSLSWISTMTVMNEWSYSLVKFHFQRRTIQVGY